MILSDIWRLMSAFREREGLTGVELKAVNACFIRYDKDQGGSVEIARVGQMIRSMGYTLSFTVQQDLLLKVDIDGSGKVDAREFRKLIRMIYRREIDIYNIAFKEALKTEEGRGRSSVGGKGAPGKSIGAAPAITVSQARLALRRVGCMDIDGEP